ncbi:Succinyl-CoA ligase [ADP-forming] subunit beta, mitochondrial [Scedosporium apiospermum]|uniref:Succinate--CoA ligase [ADP-forming] subunit beta, mitochondrial n=1 Tax=Pseudallescheria apiosperma TaxID=563466 RepID=A0A084GG39_PSEDA|nr:Succinyl-CoA ligase [ADP-forming] subunit beta, mitochondrial [Scedosporium apiospermum]KEZ46301.1 Succinyl-CoA ligase [ADP-forming] subunit beta, mitochondrial [Scedosporium apiospermum]
MSSNNLPMTLLRRHFRATRLAQLQQLRRLSLYEYQSQEILRKAGIPVPRGRVAETPAQVRDIAKELGGSCVVKSQILKGGRGKGTFDSGLKGGIHIVNNPEEGEKIAAQMLGHKLNTNQTSGDGLKVNKLLVAEAIKYSDEWYLAMTIDREAYLPAIILSKNGGVDIETTAKQTPEQLHSFHFKLSDGITPELMEKVSSTLGTSQVETNNLKDILERLYKIFAEKDATLLEINPLVRSANGSFTGVDAKFSFDKAAERRQKELFALRDSAQEVPEEVEAEQYGLIYVRMDGNIGNVVNGAGLAMATNDAIAHHGGSSANFLDAGGQATKETMQKAFEIILRDPRVKTILVNIYGGIIRCDMIAESIIGAAKELGPFRVPVVVRLQGTNSVKGLRLLEEANLGLHTEAEFGEAARKAVELAGATEHST